MTDTATVQYTEQDEVLLEARLSTALRNDRVSTPYSRAALAEALQLLAICRRVRREQQRLYS